MNEHIFPILIITLITTTIGTGIVLLLQSEPIRQPQLVGAVAGFLLGNACFWCYTAIIGKD